MEAGAPYCFFDGRWSKSPRTGENAMKDSKNLMHLFAAIQNCRQTSWKECFCEDFSKGGFLGGETSNIFYLHPYLWKIPHFDEHIFQRGWFNHQLDFLFFFGGGFRLGCPGNKAWIFFSRRPDFQSKRAVQGTVEIGESGGTLGGIGCRRCGCGSRALGVGLGPFRRGPKDLA